MIIRRRPPGQPDEFDPGISLADVDYLFDHLSEQKDWGGWVLDADNTFLEFPAYNYFFDLCALTSSARMLDTIIQVSKKTWATDKCLAGLVRALDDLMGPQATLCSCGNDTRLTETQIAGMLKTGRRRS